MPRLEIRNHATGAVIYDGLFATARDCVEQAAREGVCLDYADLRNANLANAALDDVIMREARLDGANLTGANLSEARLDGTSFTNATLHAACLCLSSLAGCGFEGSLFGATDVTGCLMQSCRFSTLSAFSLNFIDAANLEDCSFRNSQGFVCPFSKPPVALHGFALPVIFLDRHLKIGSLTKTYQEWALQANDNAPPERESGSYSYTFFMQYRSLFQKIQESLGKAETGMGARRIGAA